MGPLHSKSPFTLVHLGEVGGAKTIKRDNMITNILFAYLDAVLQSALASGVSSANLVCELLAATVVRSLVR